MKKTLILFIGLTFIVTAKGQLLGSLNLDPKDFIQIKDSAYQDTRLLESAISASFFLSRQSFQVSDKKTGERYGLNNKDVFGTELSLGIKVKNGYILTEKAMRPWKYNKKFETYKDGYNPVMYVSEYSEFAESTKYDTLDILEPKVNELLPSSLYFIASDCFLGKGLAVDYTKGKKDGWVVWTCVDEDEDLNKTAKLKITSYSKTIDSNVSDSIKIDTPDEQKILGGIFVIPVNSEIGTIEFRISGIMVESNGNWNIRFPFTEKEDNIKSKHSNGTQETNVDGKDSLTPVDDIYMPKSPKKEKVKKNKKKQKK